jgi:hypothetical protein
MEVQILIIIFGKCYLCLFLCTKPRLQFLKTGFIDSLGRTSCALAIYKKDF